MMHNQTSKAAYLPGALFVLLLFSIFAGGQIIGGLNETNATRLGGNSFVAGTVFWPSGLPVNVRMSIRLQSPTAGDYMTTTDDRGQFIFSGLTAGTYSIVIENERDFQPVNQQVEVVQSRGRTPYNISIRLIYRPSLNKKPTAINAAEAAIPKEASDLFLKASGLAKSGDRNGAIEKLVAALMIYPDYIAAFNEIAVHYLHLDNPEKAQKATRMALKVDPRAIEPLLNLGIAEFRLEQFADAETTFRKALVIKKDSAVAHYYLGRILTKLGKHDEAETELNAAIKLGGSMMNEGHRMLANLFLTKGDNQRAVAELITYLKLVPNAPDANNLREIIAKLKH